MGEEYTALFHKLEINGKVYYQCRFVVPGFIPNERFDSLLERNKSQKSDFYVTASSEKLSTRGIKENAIFIDDGSELRIVNDQNLLKSIRMKFAEERTVKANNENGSKPQELIDAYVNKIEEETKCQKKAIREIISTIVYNRELNKSSLTSLTKNMHHDNIVLIGPIGNGEDIILESVKKNLQIPVVQLTLTGDTEEDVLTIAKNIEESNKKFNGNALVIVDIDFKAFAAEYEGDSFFPLRELMTYTGKYSSPYLDAPIKFNELTYLTSVNISQEMANIDKIDAYFMKMTGCTKTIMLNKLSMTQMRNILYRSSYSVLKYCADTAKKFNREFTINRQVIASAIKFLDFFGGHVAMLNSAILESFKNQLEQGKKKITLGGEVLEYIEQVIDLEFPAAEQAPDNDVEEEDNDLSFDSETASRIDELTSEITKTIRGQDKQVRRIVKYVLKNLEYANNPDVTEPNKRKKNILVRGETGTGKTEIVRRLAKLIGVPIYVADATQYTEEGYVGDSVNEMLLDLYHEAGDDIHKAERGILVIDEIDKKANNHGDRSDISRGAVLQSLLKIVEGTKKRIKYEEALPTGAVVRKKLDFDTNRLTVICLGAFENLEKFREERIKKATKPKGMGFMSGSEQTVAEENAVKVNRNFISEDYEAYGMGNQFIPRFEGKVYLNSLSKEDMIDIMKNSNLSAIKLKQEEYLLDGVILEFTEDFYERLATIAVTKKAGARGISEALEDTFETLGLNDLDNTKYERIILNGECIDNPEALVLVPREQQKVKKL